MLSMYNYHGMSQNQMNQMHQYQSTGDLRTTPQSRSTSWYDSTSGTMPRTGQRLSGSSASLSRSMNQLNHSTAYQHVHPSTAGSYQLPQYQKVTGHGRGTVSRQPHHQNEPVQYQSTTTMPRDVGGTLGRHRRHRPDGVGSTPGGSWYRAQSESVFSEPPSAATQYRQMNDTTLRLQNNNPGRRHPHPHPQAQPHPQSHPHPQSQPHPLQQQQQRQNIHRQMSSDTLSSIPQRRSSPEPSTIDPELRNVGKTGDSYRITMSLNAALRQAELQQQQQQQVMMTDHVDSHHALAWNQLSQPSLQNSSRINLTADDIAGSQETVIASTTVVHVRDENDDQRAPTPVVNTPATTTTTTPIEFPRSSPRRRRVEPVGTSDGGFKIKSVKSMIDLRDIDDTMSVTSQSKRRYAAGGDDKVGFDVELNNGWRPSSVMETRSALFRRRQQKKQIERTGSGPARKVIDGNPPSYTMTINDTMTMNYAPSSGQEWTHKKTAVATTNEPRAPPPPPTTKIAAPKLFYEQATQMNEDPMSSAARRPVASAAPPPRRVAEQSTQANDPVNAATQTNENRGTQTDREQTPPSDNFDSPVQTSRARPNFAGRRNSDPDENNNRVPTPADRKWKNGNRGQPGPPNRLDSVDLVNSLEEFDWLVTVEVDNMAFETAPGVRAESEIPVFKVSKLESAQQSMQNGRNLDMSDSFQKLAINRSTTVSRETVSAPFGYRGKAGSVERSNYARMLMEGAPVGSVTQRERRDVEEETISRSMIGRLEYEGNQDGGQDSDAVLNMDSVSEKVDLLLANGVAELTVLVRCERIIPVRDTPDLFKKSTVIITKVIEVDLMVTEERRQLYDTIVTNQRQSTSGRLSNRDTFDLYQTFMEMAKHDVQSGRGGQQHVRIDRQVDEQKLFDLQLTDRHEFRHDATFDRVDDQLNVVHSSADVDVRSQSKRVRNVNRRQ